MKCKTVLLDKLHEALAKVELALGPLEHLGVRYKSYDLGMPTYTAV